MSYSTAALLDDFAIRSFRDRGDQDYVSARLCYRHALIPQFHWASLQALEKYLKCILVLNRIRAPRSHDLGALLAVVNQQGGLELGLSARTAAFLVHLDTYGRHRYFESSWHVLGKELLWLISPFGMFDALRAFWSPTKFLGTLSDYESWLKSSAASKVQATRTLSGMQYLVACLSRSLRILITQHVQRWFGRTATSAGHTARRSSTGRTSARPTPR